MSIHRKAWAVSGLAHLVILLGVCIGLASAQGQLPLGENRPVAKPVAVKSAGIATVALENLTPAAKTPETVELKPNQLKAFASGDGVSWDLVPKSDDATDDGLVIEEAAPGTVVFAVNVDTQRWGRFKVPEGSPVILVGCNPDAKGKYLLTKLEVVGGKVKVSERIYITVAGGKKPNPVIDDKGDDTKPKPPVVKKIRKLFLVVIEETEDKTAQRSKFLGDKSLMDYWKANGFQPPVIVDQNVVEGKTGLPPAKLVPYLNRAKGKKLPCAYFVDEDGVRDTEERTIPADMTPEQFLKLVQEVVG